MFLLPSLLAAAAAAAVEATLRLLADVAPGMAD
jgi:hypothetical protein